MNRWICLGVLAMLCAAGCNCASRPELPYANGSGRVVNLSDHPYEQVAAAMNARAQRLERLYTPVIVTVWYIGRQGEDEVDQLDGSLHVVHPTKISMNLQKVGVEGAALGANERHYWFMDLLAETPVASIGTHERANPDQLSELGVPVHPLDLLLLLGFSPVPSSPMDASALSVTSLGSHLLLRAPARWGVVEYTLDPTTYEPVRVALRRGPRLPPALTADMLERIEFVDRTDPQQSALEIPRRILIDVPALDARVRIRLLDPHVSRRRPDERAFDLGDALSRHGIRLRRDLDVAHARRQED
ncbi:MAG: hypothetical protein KIT54_10685 [Phycisphaeraceae bacterium]|nr:hypothetical protein [Phycisphaeraceae bacterium]